MTTAAPAKPPPRPAAMGPYKPDWLEKPSGEDMTQYYPDHAARHAISGAARITCKVMADGHLESCRVVAETPPGEAFGQAALLVSRKFRMIPPDDPSAPPVEVTVPLNFEAPPPTIYPMTRPTPAALRGLAWGGSGVVAVSTILLIAMIWGLGHYHNRAARRSAGKP